MGAIHNELRRGPLSEALKAALGVQQTDAGLERFGETLTPTVDLWRLPEWRLLRNEVPFARQVTAPAVAARFSTVQLINPANSGVLAVVEHILLCASGARAIELAVEQGDSTVGLNVTTAGGVSVDARHKILGEASVLTLHTADVAAGIALPQIRVRSAGNVNEHLYPDFVLGPNSKLLIFSLVVNQDFDCSIAWTERAAFKEEF